MSGHKILVVEDDESIRTAIEDYLTNEQFKVLTTKDGAEALEAVHAKESDIGLILLDLKMPRMNGEQFIDRLTHDSDPLLARIPIIIISASPNDITSENKLLFRVLKKPFDDEELFAAIKETMK